MEKRGSGPLKLSYAEYLKLIDEVKTEGRLNWLNDHSGFELPSLELTKYIKERVSCCMMVADQCDDTVIFDLEGTLEWIRKNVNYFMKTGRIGKFKTQNSGKEKKMTKRSNKSANGRGFKDGDGMQKVSFS